MLWARPSYWKRQWKRWVPKALRSHLLHDIQSRVQGRVKRTFLLATQHIQQSHDGILALRCSGKSVPLGLITHETPPRYSISSRLVTAATARCMFASWAGLLCKVPGSFNKCHQTSVLYVLQIMRHLSPTGQHCRRRPEPRCDRQSCDGHRRRPRAHNVLCQVQERDGQNERSGARLARARFQIGRRKADVDSRARDVP